MTLWDGASVRLTLPFEPPVQNGEHYAGTLADVVDDAGLHHLFSFNSYGPEGRSIHFYMQTDKRKSELKKLLRHDKSWLALLKRFPKAKIEFAEDMK